MILSANLEGRTIVIRNLDSEQAWVLARALSKVSKRQVAIREQDDVWLFVDGEQVEEKLAQDHNKQTRLNVEYNRPIPHN